MVAVTLEIRLNLVYEFPYERISAFCVIDIRLQIYTVRTQHPP
jgi:hypothetical protein